MFCIDYVNKRGNPDGKIFVWIATPSLHIVQKKFRHGSQ